MKIIKLRPEEAVAAINGYIKEKKEVFFYGVHTATQVFMGGGHNSDKEYIETAKIPVFDVPTHGGTLVISEGDVQTGLLTNTVQDYAEWTLNKFVQYLKAKKINAEKVGNDVVIHCEEHNCMYKVAAGVVKMVGNLCYNSLHFSERVNLELINCICKKPRSKIPQGLENYGITTNDIEQFVLDSFIEYANLNYIQTEI